MSSREVKVGSTVKDHFPVFEDDGYSKHSGLGVGNFTSTAFLDAAQVTIPFAISEIGSIGEYAVSFIPISEGVWTVRVYNDFNHEIWAGEYVAREEISNTLLEDIQILLQSVDVDLTRALGLLHHNAILDNQVYDGMGQLSEARLRVFDTASHVPASPGGNEVIGLLHQYRVEAEYAGAGVVTRYALKRVL